MSVLGRLYNGENTWNFPRQWRGTRWASLAAVVVSVLSISVLWLNLGLDFVGGSSWEVRAPDASVADARDVLGRFGQSDAKIQVVDGDTLRIQAPVKDIAEAQEIGNALSELGEFLGVQSVGPSWGQEITRQAVKAMIVFFVLLAGFLAWRLEWRMAVGALASVVHDVLISVGVYSLLGLAFTPATVVSLLTIVGYSMYDTIVVFDKARDLNARPSIATKYTYTDIMNTSLNQVLMRSINTTLLGLIPVATMLIVGLVQGAENLLEYATALFIGLMLGAYSSLYVAAPIVVWLKEREPKHAAVRERLTGRADGGAKRPETRLAGARVPAAAAVGTAAASAADVEPVVARAAPGGAIPPRPRKKKRR